MVWLAGVLELLEPEAGVVGVLDIDGIGVVWHLCACVCTFNVNGCQFDQKKTVVCFQEMSCCLEI